MKKYLGRKVKTSIGEKSSDVYFEEKINIVRSFEDFKNDIENEDYTSIELLEDNITLYQCAIFKNDNLAKLYEIRKKIECGKIDYNTFLTKSEIIDLLKASYVVCVEDIKEIDLDNVEDIL